MRYIRPLLTMAATLSFFPIAATAQPDPCELSSLVRVQHGNLIDGVPSFSPSMTAAENFSLPVDIEITSIGWLGGGLSGAPGTSFVISIFDDLAGLPDASSGTVVFSGGPDQSFDVGNLIAGGITEWNYCAELPASFVATANQMYWMEIRSSDGVTLWGWETSSGGDQSHAISRSGDWSTDSGGLAFSLFSPDVIPSLPTMSEPALLGLSISLLCFVFSIGRKGLRSH